MDDNSSVKFTNSNHAVARPTEGQLKWALLHQKRVAAKVHEYVERLYRYPESIHDVPAFQFTNDRQPSFNRDVDDVTSLLALEDSTISEGRRAMLHCSNLEYEHRKRCIALHGYRYHPSTTSSSDEDNDDDESHQSPNSDEMVRGRFRTNVQTMQCTNDMNMPSTGRRKKFRRRRRKFQPRCSDPERVRRFKEAFQVALHSLELATTSQNHRPQGLLTEHDMAGAAAAGESSPNMQSSRKWKRPENNDEFSCPTEAYTVYGCSTVPKRPPSVHNPTLTPGKAPLDRGATWLSLLHASHSKKMDGRTGPLHTPVMPTGTQQDVGHSTEQSRRSVLTPALRQHVADVAREIFSCERHGSGNNVSQHQVVTMNGTSSPIYNMETLERDITSFVDQFEEHLLLGSDSLDDDDSFVSSPGHPNFDVTSADAVPMSGRRVLEEEEEELGSDTVGTIVPVVTYDSDESKHHMAWNESRISKNLDETFTLQELDSSFQCWNVPTTTGPSSPMMSDTVVRRTDNVIVTYTDHLKEIDIGVTPDVLGMEPTLMLSPMNLKEFVQLLPDPADITSLMASSNNIQESVSKNGVETMEENTIQVVWPVVANDDVVSITTEANRTKSQQAPTQQQQNISTKHNRTKQSCKDSMDRNFSNPVLYVLSVQPYYQNDTSTVSAGCGLYTERNSHYDVTWERRLRL